MDHLTVVSFVCLMCYSQGRNRKRIEPSNLVKRSFYPNPVVFKCYSSTPPTWKFSGGPLPVKPQILYDDTIKVGTLSITRLNHYHTGTYTCRGTTEMGEPFTAEAVLTVLAYKSEMNPHHRKIQLGELPLVSIHCYTGTTPRWTFNGKPLLENTRTFHLEGRLFYTLEIYRPKTNNSGWYYCSGTTITGGNPFLDRARLEVLEYNTHIYPNYKRVYWGREDKVTFECLSSTAVNWTFSGGMLPKNAKQLTLGDQSKYILEISSPQISNNGYYCCEGHQLEDNAIFWDKAKLEVLKTKEKVRPAYQRVPEFSNALIYCYSSTEVVWNYRNSDLPKTARAIKPNGSKYYLLEIKQVQQKVNSGLYTCLGNDIETGEVFKETSMLRAGVNKFDDIVHPPFMRLHFKEKEIAEFTCTSQRYIPFHTSIRWTFKGGKLPNNTEVFTIRNYYVIRINNPVNSNSGLYQCKIVLDNEYLQGDARLEVLYEQYERLQPKYAGVYVNGSVSIKCISDTPPKWTFVRHGGSSSVIIPSDNINSSTYSVERSPVVKTDGGFYSCKGTDIKTGRVFQEISELEVLTTSLGELKYRSCSSRSVSC